MAKSNKQAALSFIFITLLIDVTGLGIIIPVLPKLIQTLIHGGLSEASRYAGLLTVAYSITQFIFAPILGNLHISVTNIGFYLIIGASFLLVISLLSTNYNKIVNDN